MAEELSSKLREALAINAEFGTPAVNSRRDLSLQSLVKPWSGLSGSPQIDSVLDQLELSAKCGNWSDEDMANICRLKLEGNAARFGKTVGSVSGEEGHYTTLKKSLLLRYGGHKSHEPFARELSREVQSPGDSIHEFAVRCEAYQEKLSRPALTGERAAFWQEETEQQIMLAFKRGLSGEVGKFVALGKPKTWPWRWTRLSRKGVRGTDLRFSLRRAWTPRGQSGNSGCRLSLIRTGNVSVVGRRAILRGSAEGRGRGNPKGFDSGRPRKGDVSTAINPGTMRATVTGGTFQVRLGGVLGPMSGSTQMLRPSFEILYAGRSK